MATSIGIDFGTRYCRLACLKDGQAVKLGERIPVWQAVGFRDDPKMDLPIKGKIAEPEPARWAGQIIRYPDLAIRLFVHLRQVAERMLGESVGGCVVSVPSQTGNRRREALREVVRAAGFQAVRLINESTAVSLSQSSPSRGDWTALVYCLGAGSLEATVVRRTGEGLMALASGGREAIAGQVFTTQLAHHLYRRFLQQGGPELGGNSEALQRLTLEAERVKIALSADPEVEVWLPQLAPNENLGMPVRREDFEDLIHDHLQESLALCRELTAKAGLAPTDLGELWLAGGSTAIPLLRRLVAEWYGRPPSPTPEHAVALGAALQTPTLDLSGAAPLSQVTPPNPLIQSAESPRPPTRAPDSTASLALEQALQTLWTEAEHRLKTGDHAGALQQLERVIELIRSQRALAAMSPPIPAQFERLVEQVQRVQAKVYFARGQAREHAGNEKAALKDTTATWQDYEAALRDYEEAYRLDRNASYARACARLFHLKAQTRIDRANRLLERGESLRDVRREIVSVLKHLGDALSYTPDDLNLQRQMSELKRYLSQSSGKSKSKKGRR